MPPGNGSPGSKATSKTRTRHPGGEEFRRLGSGFDLLSQQTLNLQEKPHRQNRWIMSLTQYRPGVPVQRGLDKLLSETEKLTQEGHTLSPDESDLLMAGLLEFQMRLLLEAELELAAIVYWDALFWQDRLKHPTKAWLESGPFTWFAPLEEQPPSIEDTLDKLQRALVDLSIAAGSLQQHLTRKTVNTDVGYLAMWSGEAAELIEEVMTNRLTSEQARSEARSFWVLPTGRDLTLPQCLAQAQSVPTAIKERKAEFLRKMAPLRAPSLLRRRWLYILLASPFVLYSLRWVYKSRGDLPKWTARALSSSREFFHEHVYEPTRDIVMELIFNEHPNITDAAAMQDTKESLQRMLQDFIKDTYPHMSEAEKTEAATRMDMSLVSAKYEKSLPQAIKHVVTGDIVRMLLIQVQFIKKELLVAMSAIDELMDSNQFNFRLMAIFPAVIVLYTGYQASKSVSYAVRRKKNTRDTAALLRSLLLSMERMLNLRNVGASEEDVKYHKLDRSGTFAMAPLMNGVPHHMDLAGISEEEGHGYRRQQSTDRGGGEREGYRRQQSQGGGGEREFSVPVLNPVVFLKAQDLGLLLLFLHQVTTIIARSPRLFDDMELRDFQEDLQELAGNSGLVTVTQQLATVQRMFRSYRFLNSSSSYSLFSL